MSELDQRLLSVLLNHAADPALAERDAEFFAEIFPGGAAEPPAPLLVNVLTNEDETFVKLQLQAQFGRPEDDLTEWRVRSLLAPDTEPGPDEELGAGASSPAGAATVCCVRQQAEPGLCGRAEAHAARHMPSLWLSAVGPAQQSAVWQRRLTSELVILSFEVLLSSAAAMDDADVAQIVTRSQNTAAQLLKLYDNYLRIDNKIDFAFTIRQVYYLARLHLSKRLRGAEAGQSDEYVEVVALLDLLPRLREVSEQLRSMRVPVPMILPGPREMRASPQLLVTDLNGRTGYSERQLALVADLTKGLPVHAPTSPAAVEDVVDLLRIGIVKSAKRMDEPVSVSSTVSFLRRLRTPINVAASRRATRVRRLVAGLQAEIQGEAPEGFGVNIASLEELCLQVGRTTLENEGIASSFRPYGPECELLPRRAATLARRCEAQPSTWLKLARPSGFIGN